MKIAVAVLFFLGIFGLSSGQESAPTNQAIAPSVGLEVGQQAPAFALSDQFGHQQSNETLKGSKVYELVRLYERLIYATAISVVKNPTDAEEAAQEAVLKAFSNLLGFRGESKCSTWLVPK